MPIFIALNPWIALIGSAQAEEFRRLYQIIPLPGEAAEFFVDSPRQILAGLAKRKFILVQKGSGSCCVTPAEVVRSELRNSTQADLGSKPVASCREFMLNLASHEVYRN